MTIPERTHIAIEIAVDDAHFEFEGAYDALDRCDYAQAWRALRATARAVNDAMRMISRARNPDLKVEK